MKTRSSKFVNSLRINRSTTRETRIATLQHNESEFAIEKTKQIQLPEGNHVWRRKHLLAKTNIDLRRSDIYCMENAMLRLVEYERFQIRMIPTTSGLKEVNDEQSYGAVLYTRN